MKKTKKYIGIVLFVLILITVFSSKVLAYNISDLIEKQELTQEYQEWIKLSEEEKKEVIMPRMYEIPYYSVKYNNTLLRARRLVTSLNTKFSLKDVISSNTTIRNQQNTNSCWTFASLSSLETNLALSDLRAERETKIYDFSERHMEYANSKYFANGVENTAGYKRNVGDGGQWYMAESYLTNGLGAVNESAMPFENNENLININQIQNKTVSSQVYDTIDFADYQKVTGNARTKIMNEIKQHIKDNGAVFASVHGDAATEGQDSCYNNDTGAKYCKNSTQHLPNHAVSIIGWDDNYSANNFATDSKPSSNGAWIIRNSWGERLEYNLSELKEELFRLYEQQCRARGWNSPQEIPNELFEQAGYTIEGNIAYIRIGDNGLMYVSYEDVNISKTLYGVVKASDSVEYENIYQYDEFYPAYSLRFNDSKTMLCNIYDKKTTDDEYLTQVALYAPEAYKCRVYVNPNGTSKAKNDMQLIQLKDGETETISAGYHTLEFAEPVKITGNKFAVAVEIEGFSGSGVGFKIESKVSGMAEFDPVHVESNKCFVATSCDFDTCTWIDLSTLGQSGLIDGDSTIKAFTVSNVSDGSLLNIEIVTPPNKTSYFEGENFDPTGMVVKANYNSITNPSVILDNSSYNILNGNNLKEGQNKVTISYENKTADQAITVEKNSVIELIIATPPAKTEYKEGQNFDRTGMVVNAKYKDGNVTEITDYLVVDGNNLKADQTEVTISYGSVTAKQPITVLPNRLEEIRITRQPNKTTYIEGQNFDKTGMVVTGYYEDNTDTEILNYTIENGNNLRKEQTSVTIKYEGKTAEQNITVEEKNLTGISLYKQPTKLQYIQNKEELDLSGGIIKAEYNDNTSVEIALPSEDVKVSGFSNATLGKVTITLEYQTKTTSFEVEIIEEKKPENSNFDNAKCEIKSTKYYTYTDPSKQEYFIMDISINNIVKNNNNDSMEYYYYLSSTQNEKNIVNWVKITEKQDSDNSIKFKINSKDISNYEEIYNANNVYLYIKEVAKLGGNQTVIVSKALKLEPESTLEIYLDDKKKIESDNEDPEPEEPDDTLSKYGFPNAGSKIMIAVLVIVSVFAIIRFIRYIKLKDLK